MIVIADTTPLISLLKLNRLDLLKELFSTVYIPNFVLQELISNPKYKSEADTILNSQFIITKSITDTTALHILMRINMLDRGESEAIILANELNAEIIV